MCRLVHHKLTLTSVAHRTRQCSRPRTTSRATSGEEGTQTCLYNVHNEFIRVAAFKPCDMHTTLLTMACARAREGLCWPSALAATSLCYVVEIQQPDGSRS
jgi:hypothetical protein